MSVSPWYFLRDEFDFLEEEFDRIFDRHAEVKNPAVLSMEHRVMDEQAQAEEEYEACLEDAWTTTSEECHAEEGVCVHHRDILAPDQSLRDLLYDHQTKDPLYAQALVWGMGVFEWAGRRYPRRCPTAKRQDVFRVHMNACLVPVKVAAARMDEEGEGEATLDLALQGYDLSLVYLQRTWESLKRIAEQPGEKEGERIENWLQEGVALRAKIERTRQELLDRRSFYQTPPHGPA
ncbi:hypothetical protein HY734_02890 [Candidatus Uhrbacteria bacterium]|nr:hypothetical protein [Candidatus Uhrbacteria bacterium]